MTTPDFTRPETWRVGDTIDAETWERRVHDPLRFMLRRPLLVARRTTNLTVTASTGQQSLPFDTVDQDDDGMVTTDLPTSIFYAQRSGIYSLWFSAPFIGNGANGRTVGVRALVNGNNYQTRETVTVGTTVGQDHFRAATGDVVLTEGDSIEIVCANFLTTNITVQAIFNAPRVCILYKRPS